MQYLSNSERQGRWEAWGSNGLKATAGRRVATAAGWRKVILWSNWEQKVFCIATVYSLGVHLCG